MMELLPSAGLRSAKNQTQHLVPNRQALTNSLHSKTYLALHSFVPSLTQSLIPPLILHPLLLRSYEAPALHQNSSRKDMK